jgi:transaldolase
MKATGKLHDAGQSIWLDNITRGLLDSGTLQKYVNELSVTGLTSNPTIFDQAISKGADYDEAIRRLTAQGRAGEDLFFDLAIDDLTRAATSSSRSTRRRTASTGTCRSSCRRRSVHKTHRRAKALGHAE